MTNERPEILPHSTHITQPPCKSVILLHAHWSIVKANVEETDKLPEKHDSTNASATYTMTM